MHDFATDSRPETSRIPTRGGRGRTKLPHDRNNEFISRWHPLRWQWVEVEDDSEPSGEWLPLLGDRTHSLGVNGIGFDHSTVFADAYDKEHGWTVVPYDLTPDGRDYVIRTECRNGWYHHTRWETPRHIAGRGLASSIDLAGYWSWLRWLVTEGHIPPMSADALTLCTAPQRERIASLQRDERQHPHLTPKLERERARLARMLGETAAPAKPKPRKRRARKATKATATTAATAPTEDGSADV